jgi:hypothetical protein
LEEHLVCNQKVAGSSPAGSTSTRWGGRVAVRTVTRWRDRDVERASRLEIPPGRAGTGWVKGRPTAVAGRPVCERSSAAGPVRRILSAHYAAAGGDRPQASCLGGILQQ